ncbi:MAG: CNNM domain-containing protein [Candidatus Binatia bacterium]
MNLLLVFFAMVALLLLKGFFSGSEIALVNADKLRLHHQANQGRKGARLVLSLFRTPEILLGTTLVGTNVCTVAFTTLGTTTLISYVGEPGDLYAFLLFTPLLLLFGEIVPKSVYQQKSTMLAPIIIYPLRACSFLFYPVVFIFSQVARLTARLVGGGKVKQNLFSRENRSARSWK